MILLYLVKMFHVKHSNVDNVNRQYLVLYIVKGLILLGKIAF